MHTDNNNTAHTPTGAESILPYNSSEKGKTGEVEEMFDNIARTYDRMNAVMSFGLHHFWRNKAIALASDALKENGMKPESILDIATGTGDVAIHLAKSFEGSNVTGSDISSGMLKIAEQKRIKLPQDLSERIKFEVADCLNLPYPDNSYDLITVAYGVRNFEHLEQGYKEMLRVLKSGGVVCVVELSQPENGPALLAYNAYSNILIPLIGKLASGDKRAYTYLPESIAAAPQRKSMAKIMQKTGFKRCRWKSLTLGAVTIYIAQKQ